MLKNIRFLVFFVSGMSKNWCVSTSDRPRDLFFTRVGAADVSKSSVFRHPIVPGTYFLQGSKKGGVPKSSVFRHSIAPGTYFLQ